MTLDSSYIARTLSWSEEDLKRHTIEDTEILEFHQPVIILGDPGMGKTFLMERLGGQPECKFIRATSFLRQPVHPITSDKRLVIDGLDEVAAVEEGDPLHNILTKLIARGKPPFVISCRSAEWQSATGKIDITDEYGQLPI
ncbi:MAG: hypothetical protein GY875_17800 [Gammaproteobacteria bacterium]|nr:hypothetical protein [Gammaproteobacteria bacterium]